MKKVFEKILKKTREKCKQSYITNHGNDYTEFDICTELSLCFNEVQRIVQEVAEEYNGGWIPIKTRPMTEEEKEYYSEYLFEGNGLIYECPLPEDGQEVLITSKYGSVDKTTFYTDCGNYFENYEDYDEVIAWQPLPEPFKERD